MTELRKVFIADENTGDLAGVNNVNQLEVSSPPLEISQGKVPGYSPRTIFGYKSATTTESTVSEGLTGRYPFPSTATTLTVVSTSANDTATGTGAQAVFIRGLTVDGSDWVSDSELVSMNGTTPVTTTKSWIRVLNVVCITVGSTGSNEGNISVNNGADVLLWIGIGTNLSLTCVWSTATNQKAYGRMAILSSAKAVDSVIFRFYLIPTSPFKLPRLEIFKITNYLNSYNQPSFVPFELAGGSDFEVTVSAVVGTIDTTALVEFTLVEE